MFYSGYTDVVRLLIMAFPGFDGVFEEDFLVRQGVSWNFHQEFL